MRATALDSCGRIKSQAISSITTDGFVSVALTAVIQEAEVISVTNAGGKVCVEDKGTPEHRGYGVAITFCNVNPQLYAMMTNQVVVFDGAGNAVGFRVNTGRSTADANFALEVWSGVGTSDVCSGDQSGMGYGYTLLPFISGGVLGDFTLENNAVTFTLQNAATKDGTQWDVGPYDVVDDNGTPSPLLEPLDVKDHLHVQYTTIAPPEPDCDADASGPKSTGATQGAPATLTPADSYPPADFATLTGGTHNVTATPGTAWTTGNYLLLGDGSRARWNGTAWVVGTAP